MSHANLPLLVYGEESSLSPHALSPRKPTPPVSPSKLPISTSPSPTTTHTSSPPTEALSPKRQHPQQAARHISTQAPGKQSLASSLQPVDPYSPLSKVQPGLSGPTAAGDDVRHDKVDQLLGAETTGALCVQQHSQPGTTVSLGTDGSVVESTSGNVPNKESEEGTAMAGCGVGVQNSATSGDVAKKGSEEGTAMAGCDVGVQNSATSSGDVAKKESGEGAAMAGGDAGMQVSASPSGDVVSKDGEEGPGMGSGGDIGVQNLATSSGGVGEMQSPQKSPSTEPQTDVGKEGQAAERVARGESAAIGRGTRGRGRGSAGRAARKKPTPEKKEPDLFAKRRAQALRACLRLLEGVDSVEQLMKVSAPLGKEEYEQVAEERALAGKCGNPLCSNPHSWIPEGIRLQLKDSEIAERLSSNYCSSVCEYQTRQYAIRLGNPLDRLNSERLKQLDKLVSHQSRKQSPNKPKAAGATGGGVVTMLADVQEKDPALAAAEAALAAQLQQEQPHASSAVEGYVPRNEQLAATDPKSPNRVKKSVTFGEVQELEFFKTDPAREVSELKSKAGNDPNNRSPAPSVCGLPTTCIKIPPLPKLETTAALAAVKAALSPRPDSPGASPVKKALSPVKASSSPLGKVSSSPTKATPSSPTEKVSCSPTKATPSLPSGKFLSPPTKATTPAPSEKASSSPTKATPSSSSEKASSSPTKAKPSSPSEKVSSSPTKATPSSPSEKALSTSPPKATTPSLGKSSYRNLTARFSGQADVKVVPSSMAQQSDGAKSDLLAADSAAATPSENMPESSLTHPADSASSENTHKVPDTGPPLSLPHNNPDAASPHTSAVAESAPTTAEATEQLQRPHLLHGATAQSYIDKLKKAGLHKFVLDVSAERSKTNEGSEVGSSNRGQAPGGKGHTNKKDDTKPLGDTTSERKVGVHGVHGGREHTSLVEDDRDLLEDTRSETAGRIDGGIEQRDVKEKDVKLVQNAVIEGIGSSDCRIESEKERDNVTQGGRKCLDSAMNESMSGATGGAESESEHRIQPHNVDEKKLLNAASGDEGGVTCMEGGVTDLIQVGSNTSEGERDQLELSQSNDTAAASPRSTLTAAPLSPEVEAVTGGAAQREVDSEFESEAQEAEFEQPVLYFTLREHGRESEKGSAGSGQVAGHEGELRVVDAGELGLEGSQLQELLGSQTAPTGKLTGDTTASPASTAAQGEDGLIPSASVQPAEPAESSPPQEDPPQDPLAPIKYWLPPGLGGPGVALPPVLHPRTKRPRRKKKTAIDADAEAAKSTATRTSVHTPSAQDHGSEMPSSSSVIDSGRPDSAASQTDSHSRAMPTSSSPEMPITSSRAKRTSSSPKVPTSSSHTTPTSSSPAMSTSSSALDSATQGSPFVQTHSPSPFPVPGNIELNTAPNATLAASSSSPSGDASCVGHNQVTGIQADVNGVRPGTKPTRRFPPTLAPARRRSVKLLDKLPDAPLADMAGNGTVGVARTRISGKNNGESRQQQTPLDASSESESEALTSPDISDWEGGSNFSPSDEDGVKTSDDDLSDDEPDAMIPFFGAPPKKFQVVLTSAFGQLLQLLNKWTTPNTVESLKGGSTAPWVPQQLITQAACDAQRTACGMLTMALPRIMTRLKVRVPESDVSKGVLAVARSWLITPPLPSLPLDTWQLIVCSILQGLSWHRLPALQELFQDTESERHQALHALLTDLGSSVAELRCLAETYLPA